MYGIIALLVSLLVPMTSLVANLPNPFIPQRADPWIYHHSDGRYYFVATVPAYDRIELRSADTLEALPAAEPHTIWRRHVSGPMSHHIWAPELHFIEGKWYIHFAAGRSDAVWAIRMYVLENASSDPLQGEWIERGQIETPWDTFSLDATTFSHRDQRYLVWAQHEPGFDGNTALWIAEMEDPWTLSSDPVKLSEPQFHWETQLYKVNEGAAVIRRNGRVFIAYSASGTDHNYAVGLLWADENADLLDPGSWHKSPGPVFRSSEENGIYGPGHNSFTTDSEGRDILVYHARNYKEIEGNALRDPNRHTRLQVFGWTEDGFPDFGMPRSETRGAIADRPLYRDPVHDGAADPVVIWNPERGRWWMFYTNRRAQEEGLSGVSWVHGTRIGIAESSDGGASWQHVGNAEVELPDALGGSRSTHWAPEVVTGPDGQHHMYLTVVPGVFEDWNHPRSIAHLTSDDMRHWRYESTLDLASDRVIDACVARLPGGSWRMWYNNERDGKSIYYADSPDLFHWTDGEKVVGDRPGEGPKVFHWRDHYWMLTDVWDGLGAYRSSDGLEWERQSGENLLQQPGSGPDDGVPGQHPDVVVQGDEAYLFYFTHPGRTSPDLPDNRETRRSTIHVAKLQESEGRLSVDRDDPVQIRLDPGLVTLSAVPATRPTIWLIGDSTVNTPTAGQDGWGEVIGPYFKKDAVRLKNRAMGGRSSRTFITEGRWEKVVDSIREGDFVLIQFGHNDSSPINDDRRARGTLDGVGEETQEISNLLTGEDETVFTYGHYLRRYVRDARKAGATPIICSLVPRKIWEDGRIRRDKGSYAGWAEAIARETDTPFVDLNEIIARGYEILGPQAVEAFFADEHTHTTPAGARFSAEAVIAGLKGLPGQPFESLLSEPAQPIEPWRTP